MRSMYKTSKRKIDPKEISEAKEEVLKCVKLNKTFQKYLRGSQIEDTVLKRLMVEYLYIRKSKLKLEFSKMIENYNYFPLEAYPDLLKEAYDVMKKAFPDENKFNLLPVMTAGDIRKRRIKSSNLMQYLYQGTFFRTFTQVAMTREYTYTNKELKKGNDGTWILVDDFIGTGSSLADSYSYWKRRGVEISGAMILVSMANGLKYLQNELPQLKVYSGRVIRSGCTGEDAKALSNELGIKQKGKNYCTGALVTMARTPNNTVQCFYKSGSVDRQKILPPFMR